MTRKLAIHYYENRCIGQGSCAAIAPQYFQLSNEKTILKGSSQLSEEVRAVEFCGDGLAAEEIIHAAQACPVNAIRVIDLDKNIDIVTVQVDQKDCKEVIANYDDATEFVLDPQGYFLIKVDRENRNIEVGFCNGKNKLVLKVSGKKPIDIYTTIFNKEKLLLRNDHAAYLGRELQKAYIALQRNILYVQDDELEFEEKV